MSYDPSGGGIGGSVSGSKVVVSTGSNTVGDSTMESSGVVYLDNITSDVQYQLDNKQATLISGTNIKTINGSTVLGSGDLIVTGTTPAVQTSVAQRGLMDYGLTVTATGDANGAVGDLVGVHYVADAEITA